MTAASDAHDHVALGTAYSILEADTFSVAGVLDAIRKGPRFASTLSHSGQRPEKAPQIAPRAGACRLILVAAI